MSFRLKPAGYDPVTPLILPKGIQVKPDQQYVEVSLSTADAQEDWGITLHHESASKLSQMLVLSRKENESIIINNNILVSVAEIFGNRSVRIGIHTAPDVIIHGDEINEQAQKLEEKLNPNISITIVEIRSGKVRLGITAPKNYPVHRLESFEGSGNTLDTTNWTHQVLTKRLNEKIQISA